MNFVDPSGMEIIPGIDGVTFTGDDIKTALSMSWANLQAYVNDRCAKYKQGGGVELQMVHLYNNGMGVQESVVWRKNWSRHKVDNVHAWWVLKEIGGEMFSSRDRKTDSNFNKVVEDDLSLFGTLVGQFEGVDICESSKYNDGSALTIPGIGIFVKEGLYKNRNVKNSESQQTLWHEYGHVLQYKYFRGVEFAYIGLSSIFSAWTTDNNNEHQHNWTEISANTLAYFYFGCPSSWNKSYVATPIYISPSIIKKE